MSDEQFDKLAMLLSRSPMAPPPPAKDGMLDNALKLATTLCTAGVVWLISSVSTMKTNQIVMQNNTAMMAEQIQAIEANTKERFTREDFNRERSELVADVQEVVEELKDREDWMDDIEDRVKVLELQSHD